MSLNARSTLLTAGVLLAIAFLTTAGFVWSGVYDIGADSAHTRPVYAVLEAARDRSIDTRARKLQAPADLMDPARVRQGAGNYDAMCTGCHLAPGMTETELRKGLYPSPPNLTKTAVDPARAFWVIKHGIKASGMPAWGRSMDDEYIWNMAAFLQELPKLDAGRYKVLVASSGGHSHGGGETGGRSDEQGVEDHHDAEGDHPHASATSDTSAHSHDARPVAGVTHVHADGKQHVHAAPATTKASKAESKPAEPAKSEAPASAEPPADEGAGHEHHH